MILGHFYLVHHSKYTYNITTEIKLALHNRVLLPHLFSFQDYEHKLADKNQKENYKFEIQNPITVCNIFTN